MRLAVAGHPAAVIVVADQPTPAELTAAQELASYLGQITGGKFTVSTEGIRTPASARIYVGPTRAALSAGIDCSRLGPEEWVVRSSGEDLILAGGRPRGTI